VLVDLKTSPQLEAFPGIGAPNGEMTEKKGPKSTKTQPKKPDDRLKLKENLAPRSEKPS